MASTYSEISLAEPDLFQKSLIPHYVHQELPQGYTIRPLRASDYDRGVLDVLKVLTTVGKISRTQFQAQFDYWHKRNDTYFTIVIVDNHDKVVAVGSVVVERKLIHECGSVGHIEDIAVASNQQGKKLGLRLIHALTDIGKVQGAYKIILDCSDSNSAFYEKCGYAKSAVQMSIKFNSNKSSL